MNHYCESQIYLVDFKNYIHVQKHLLCFKWFIYVSFTILFTIITHIWIVNNKRIIYYSYLICIDNKSIKMVNRSMYANFTQVNPVCRQFTFTDCGVCIHNFLNRFTFFLIRAFPLLCGCLFYCTVAQLTSRSFIFWVCGIICVYPLYHLPCVNINVSAK